MRLIRESVSKTWAGWCLFWFESAAPEQMKVFRFLTGTTLFGFYLTRTPDLAFFYSENGILPMATAKALMPLEYRWSVFSVFGGDAALWVGHVLFLASLATMALGFWPRLSAFIAYVLHVSFLHRNMAMAFGIDMIGGFYLLYLSFACVDPRAPRESLRRMAGSLAYRLCQFQLCVIYAFSGMEKLRGISWWKGEAIWSVLANAQLARFDFAWASHFPLMIVLPTWGTLLFEIYFPALIWVPKLRRAMLAAGLSLHLGIALAMNLPFFAAIMVATYGVFLGEQDARFLSLCVKKWFIRTRFTSESAQVADKGDLVPPQAA